MLRLTCIYAGFILYIELYWLFGVLSTMIFKKLSLFILLLVIGINVFAQETLVFSFDVIRHGDRTPLREIPKAPHVWLEGLGQLTAEGMQQEFQRGVEFRKKYVE